MVAEESGTAGLAVAVVNTYLDRGGAARAAKRLQRGLNGIGLRSWMVVEKAASAKYAERPDVHALEPVETKTLARIQQEQINSHRSELSDTLFSLNYPGVDLANLSCITEADIVNLHWVSKFLSTESVERLIALGKPVVWTLHDMRPFTGGCHYSAGCRGYEGDCNSCPQLLLDEYSIPRSDMANKVTRWGAGLTVVTPSRWLAELAGKSSVFGKCRIEVIANSLETDVFRPEEQAAAKKFFGLGDDHVSLLIGAENQAESRKGFHLAVDMLHALAETPGIRSLIAGGRLNVLTFGKPHGALEGTGIPCRPLGFIEDDTLLARAYSAADIFVLPSLEDNLPNTMLESMACGTPVVAFNAGGMPEAVEPGITGDLADPFDARDMAARVARLAADEGARRKMTHACRAFAEERYTLEVQAKNYGELFRELLHTRGETAREQGVDSPPREGDDVLLPMTNNLFPAYRRAAQHIAAELDNRERKLKQQRREIRRMQQKVHELTHSWSYRLGLAILRPIAAVARLLGVMKSQGGKRP